MKSGQADQTMSCMRDMDPSLGLWDTYLTAACRFFSKKSLFSVLLRTQLYMNVSVFVCACDIICVNFLGSSL